MRGDEADVVCCAAVIRTVPLADVEQAMSELGQLGHDLPRACPHFGVVNTFLGWFAVDEVVCSERGEGVSVDLPRQ